MASAKKQKCTKIQTTFAFEKALSTSSDDPEFRLPNEPSDSQTRGIATVKRKPTPGRAPRHIGCAILKTSLTTS